MAQELHDDGFHEIQLSGKQLVFLFMATTVVSIVIFLCGVLVGRGVQHARGTVAEAAGLDTSVPAAVEDDTAIAPTSDKPTPVTGLSYPANLTGETPPATPVEPGAADDVGQVTSQDARAAAEPSSPPAAPKEAPAPAPAP
jgi:hypothetical protein